MNKKNLFSPRPGRRRFGLFLLERTGYLSTKNRVCQDKTLFNIIHMFTTCYLKAYLQYDYTRYLEFVQKALDDKLSIIYNGT